MKRVPRELGYLWVTLPLAVPAFVLAALGVVFSVLSLFTIGLPFLTGVLWAGRGVGAAFRAMGRAMLGWDLAAPRPRRAGSAGPIAWGRAVLRDGQGWRALGYCFLKLPLTAVAVYASGILLLGGLYTVTCPAWWWLSPTGFGTLDVGPWGHAWYIAATGAAALLLFPWLVRGAVAVDRLLAMILLTPSPAQERIARLESARAALAADAAATLRRVERDLHDGTQARLVSLGVTLSRIRHRLDRGETTELDALVDAARGTVADGLAELRDIVRGIHPPALDDGLATALTTLASRSGLPAEVTVALDAPPADPVATTVYFTAAELLSNAARHAGATRVRLTLTADDHTLRLAVTDDGHGGAAPGSDGTGLAGLARRADALDGHLDIDSPAGGPTTVTLTVPKG